MNSIQRKSAMYRYTLLIVFVLWSLGIPLRSSRAQSVPFVVPGGDATPSATNFAKLLDKEAGVSGFVCVKDGHFFTGERRVRFWGMNLCFGANFPTHDEAEKVAAHLAKLGCNAVRFHHMDMLDAPNGIWQTNADGSRTFSPEQVDRLDYFLAQLHENGIYANINLHVSRTLRESEGFPQLESGPWWADFNKWVTYYDPDVQAELKEYCRELLGHVNPYRKLKRTDDPGIALIEMLNENFFSVQGASLLAHLPDRFVKSYHIKWNAWLQKKYRTHQALELAWQSPKNVTKPEPIFTSANWIDGLGEWALEPETPFMLHPAEFDELVSAARFEPQRAFELPHHRQLRYHELSLVKDEPYELSFWVRSDRQRDYSFEVSSVDVGGWRSVGVLEDAQASPEWVQVKHSFIAKETIDAAYFAISFGTSDIPIELAGAQLVAGGAGKIPAGQRLEDATVGVPSNNFPRAAITDHQEFMLETERAWILELRGFLKDELGVKVPITASQEDYHATGLVAETVDFVDLHTYWHHPTFPPGKEFSRTEYRTGNVAMETQPLQSEWPAMSLITRAGWRYHGMPFTLSEWNHAEPGDFGTGAVMMAAVVGALQDWDGVFFFDYESESGAWFLDHYDGFFDFNSQPVKLATFSAASNIFLRQDLPPLPSKLNGTFEDRLDGRLALTHRLGVDVTADAADSVAMPEGLRFETPDRSLVWDASDTPKSHLILNTLKSQGVWGLIANQQFSFGQVDVKFGSIERDYGTLLLTALDDRPIKASSHLLLLASAGAENVGMKWNADRTSVGDQWGTGPTRVNLVPATVSLALGDKFVVHALDGTGARLSEVNAEFADKRLVFEIGAPHQTIWYELSKE